MIDFQKAQLSLNKAAMEHATAETNLREFNDGHRGGDLGMFVQDSESATFKLSLAARDFSRECIRITRR